ncbi:MAG: ATP-binding cassette domain-containing protein [Nitrospirales bacterium]|nr:ATP-binding cassette domain-containing protein [Nitrospirales bacterium]
MVHIQQLRKEFGPITAVDGISFSVNKGEVLGFLGPNGAGKSTTMKMITGFLTPTSGTVIVKGFDIQDQPLQAKQQLGYLPEGAPAYPDMTPADFLAFIAEMRGFRGEEIKRRVEETITHVHLENVLNQPIETLSKGFKRRVGLAQAILHDPDVLILDEPTDGLDPNQKHEVRSLIQTMAAYKAIILSTHILEEVHAVCTRAMIIAKGKIITDGTPAELESQSPHHHAVRLRVKTGHASRIREALQQLPGIRAIEDLERTEDTLGFLAIPIKGQSILGDISQCSREHKWEVVELSIEQGQLDDVFRSLTVETQPLS